MSTPHEDPTAEAVEYDAAMQWLQTLHPVSSPAAVVPQEVRDVAGAVDRVHAAEDELVAAVLRARAAGASWNELALALGVSRQAARQRFAPLEQAAAQHTS
ncbi:hypothetical protein GCM10027586_03000 [Kineococcus gypseus]|uniref:sigma-70 family RNA polymerase sigma factor n=1 Tax=Kineococcus gypseus TaxID=1637102 RepID=UPI003D7C741A